MLRTAEETSYRLLASYAVATAAFQRPPEMIREWLCKSKVIDRLSPWERAFVEAEEPPQNAIVAASWRSETCPVLAWALQLTNEVGPTSLAVDIDEMGIDFVALTDPALFASRTRLRDERELWTYREEIEKVHWGTQLGAAGRTHFKFGDFDQGTDSSIVYQRHYAINWILGFGRDWDSVPAHP